MGEYEKQTLIRWVLQAMWGGCRVTCDQNPQKVERSAQNKGWHPFRRFSGGLQQIFSEILKFKVARHDVFDTEVLHGLQWCHTEILDYSFSLERCPKDFIFLYLIYPVCI